MAKTKRADEPTQPAATGLADARIEAIKKVVAAHLLPEGKMCAITILCSGSMRMTPQELVQHGNMTRGEVELGAGSLRAAKMLVKGDASDGSVILNPEVFA